MSPMLQNRDPVMMSAFVFPGIGQLMQRRWVAGVFFIATFGACNAWLIWALWPILHFFYVELPRFAESVSVDPPSWGQIAWPMAACILILAINVLDAWRASQRLRRPPQPPPIPSL